jgi:hypothetical protein
MCVRFVAAVACLAVVAGIGAASASAQEPVKAEAAKTSAVESTVTTDVLNYYVWRGNRLSQGFVIQPAITTTHKGFSVNVWGNLDGNEYPYASGNAGGRFTESDVTVSYGRDLGNVGLSGGYIYYGLVGLPDTWEGYVSVSPQVALSPSVSFYYDFGTGDGGFLTFSAGRTFNLTPNVPLRIGGLLSYNLGNAVMGPGMSGSPFNGFYHGELTASIGIPLGQWVTLTPRAGYTFPLTDDAKNAIRFCSYGGATSNLWTAGVTLTVQRPAAPSAVQ